MLSLYREKCKVMYTNTDLFMNATMYMRSWIVTSIDSTQVITRSIMRKVFRSLIKRCRAWWKMKILVQLLNSSSLGQKYILCKSLTKKIKGIKSNVIAKSTTFDYIRCLRDKIEMTQKQFCVRSKLHEDIHDIHNKTKIVISPYNEKRYIIYQLYQHAATKHYKIPL